MFRYQRVYIKYDRWTLEVFDTSTLRTVQPDSIMKLSLAAFTIAAITGLASAASFDQLPPCAIYCLISRVASAEIDVTDVKAVCGNASVISSATTCIQGACPAAIVSGKLLEEGEKGGKGQEVTSLWVI